MHDDQAQDLIAVLRDINMTLYELTMTIGSDLRELRLDLVRRRSEK